VFNDLLIRRQTRDGIITANQHLSDAGLEDCVEQFTMTTAVTAMATTAAAAAAGGGRLLNNDWR